MKVLKLLFIILLSSVIIYLSTDIESKPLEEEKLINVEIKGYVQNPGTYQLKSGSTLDDLLKEALAQDEADLSTLSLQNILYNGQLIVIPKKKKETLISINSADISELVKLPGIGEKTAQKIIDYRNEFGSFLSLEELMNVSGIGNAKYNKIKPFITL